MVNSYGYNQQPVASMTLLLFIYTSIRRRWSRTGYIQSVRSANSLLLTNHVDEVSFVAERLTVFYDQLTVDLAHKHSLQVERNKIKTDRHCLNLSLKHNPGIRFTKNTYRKNVLNASTSKEFHLQNACERRYRKV